jgi:hypothetical protein
VDYDLTRLGDREFEHLTQALALQVLGTGVSVFGDGPDGGREATFEGRTRFPQPGEHWDGYGVVQAKFKRRPVGGARDVTDLLRAIQAELTAWADPHSNRVRKGRRPQYLLFTTNVALSAVPGEGGIDRVDALIERYADRLGLKGWQVWHYEQLCRLLDQHPQVRRTYAALITSSDVLASLQELLDGTAATVGQRLTVHAAKELTAQQWVRLDQAGHPDNQKLLLSEVAVDLPAAADVLGDAIRLERHARLLHGRIVRAADYRPYELPVVAHLVLRGDAVLRPSCQPMINPRVVLVGGPGQGKSTLGQLLCQVYRVALLSDRPETSLGPAAVQVLRAQRSRLARLAIPTPSCRRWPLQVSLSAYGDAIAGGEDVSLLRFLAGQVSRHEPGLVTANQLRSWLAEWPWVLVLDGLDEVVAPMVREALLQHIADFLTDAADADADLMIVATTRPQGYAQELPTAHYEHLELRPLSSREAVRYAERLAAVRHAGDPHLEAQVVARLTQAADDPRTARLMRSPLQVTIMSILLERRVRAPKDRHGLFEAYYHTIYEREVAKPGMVGQLLEQQRGHVNALHERVGLLLQIRAEHAGDADALLPNQDLHRLASQRLLAEGYADADADDLATQLVTAATTRLVLLVPRTVDAVGFEVRSLQEFMAASALVADDDRSVLQRLRQLAPSAHWHNTWLLAAGRVFAQREHLRDLIVTLLEDIDTADLLALLVLPGAQVAVAILDDAIAAQTPRYQRLFAKRALALIEFPLPTDTTRRLADTLLEICQADSQTRLMIDQTLDRMVASSAPAAISAITILARWEEHVGPVAASARQRLQRLVTQLSRSQEEALVPLAARFPTGPLAPLLRAADPNAKRKPRTLPRVVRRHVPLGALEPEVEKRVRLLLDRLPPIPLLPDDAQPVLEDATASDHPVHDEGPPDDPTLTDPRVGEVLVHAAAELATRDWQAAAALRGVLAYWLARRVASEQLL